LYIWNICKNRQAPDFTVTFCGKADQHGQDRDANDDQQFRQISTLNGTIASARSDQSSERRQAFSIQQRQSGTEIGLFIHRGFALVEMNTRWD
jgi:hypothetical protein